MIPERKKKVQGKLVEEYIWNGDYKVYVDHVRVDLTFSEACESICNGSFDEEGMQFS